MFDLNNFLIDRVLGGYGTSQADDSLLFSLSQVQNPTISHSADNTSVTDNKGVEIASFDRAKNVEFSAENAIYDINLHAAQIGTTKQVADTGATIVVPAFDEIKFVTGTTEYELTHTPKVAPKFIYMINSDSSLGQKYAVGTAASATEFAIDGTSITLPTGVAAGSEFMVMYDYESENAVQLVNSADEFPKACKLTLSVLGTDVCDQTTLRHAYLVFPNFKLSSAFDWNIQTDGVHPFSGKAMQDYCSRDKVLYRLIVTE